MLSWLSHSGTPTMEIFVVSSPSAGICPKYTMCMLVRLASQDMFNSQMYFASCWNLDINALEGGKFQIQMKDFYPWASDLRVSSVSNLPGNVYWAGEVYGVWFRVYGYLYWKILIIFSGGYLKLKSSINSILS